MTFHFIGVNRFTLSRSSGPYKIPTGSCVVNEIVFLETLVTGNTEQ